MASLSLCIVMVAILLWGSGLTIVANSCRRQKPPLLPKRVSSVTERCKTNNAVKFTAFMRCEDTTACQVQASARKHCLACVSQVWDLFKPTKSELCENTKLLFKALESPQNSNFWFSLGAPNNGGGQSKSLHCFHSVTVYSYYSLQYPLSSLVLTTPVSPTPLSSSICSLSSYLPPFLSPCDIQHPPQPREKLNWETRSLYTFFIVHHAHPPFHAGFLVFMSVWVLVRRKESGGEGRKKKLVDVSPQTCDLC